MKKLIFALLVLFCWNAFGEPETEVVTQEQFEKHQAKQKEKEAKNKTPYVEGSQTLIASEKKLSGNKYRVRLVMGGVLKFQPIRNMTACSFAYSQHGDQGFGKMTGDGFYFLEAEAKFCRTIQDRLVDGGDSATYDAVVEFKDTVKTVDKQGRNLTLPRLIVQGSW